MFLTLVGLTALAVGGVGAGQAVGAFLDRKRAEIATLKSLGADGGLIFLTFFLQVMAIAALAVVAGWRWARPCPSRSKRFTAARLPAPGEFRALSRAACCLPPCSDFCRRPLSPFRRWRARARSRRPACFATSLRPRMRAGAGPICWRRRARALRRDRAGVADRALAGFCAVDFWAAWRAD